MTEKHEFAFFSDDIAQLTRINQEYSLRDADVARRLLSVLRLQPDDQIILFNDTMHVACNIVAAKKQEIIIRVKSRSENRVLLPKIIFLLPLLEREPFGAALEALTVMGATEIIPVITQKSRKKWGDNKERDRARRLMIAAAEQSKQFVLPKIHETVSLQDALKHQNVSDSKIFFDAQGQPAFDVVGNIKKGNPQSIIVLVGPEGDLTVAEKEMVQKHDFVFCKLTPTILRASAAVEVGMGLIRSCL